MNGTWEPTRLGDVLAPTSRIEQVDQLGEYRLLGVRLEGSGAFHRETKLGSELSATNLRKVEAGDFIYSRLFAWRGAFGVIGPDLHGSYVSSEFPTFQPVDGKIDVEFLRLWFRLPTVIHKVEADCSGSTPQTRNRFKEPFFLAMKVPLPPLSEQQRIVARIEELAARIEEARGLRRQAVKETNAFLIACVTQALGDTPVEGCLGDVLTMKPRNGWSVRCDNPEDGIPVLSLGAVTGFRYKADEYKTTSESTAADAHYWLRQGDLLITRSNTPELVGHAAIYDGLPEPCIYPDLMMRLVVDEDQASKRFVHYWLMSTRARDYIQRNAKGTSPSMKKISQGIVLGIPFPSKLSIDQQRRIVIYLDGLQAKVDSLKRLQSETAAELDALLPSVLDQAFKGKL